MEEGRRKEGERRESGKCDIGILSCDYSLTCHLYSSIFSYQDITSFHVSIKYYTHIL